MSMMEIHEDDDRIVTLTFAAHDKSANAIDTEFITSFAAVVNDVTSRDNVTGVILTSAKKDFVVGGDLGLIAGMRDMKEAAAFVDRLKAILLKLETFGRPVVAAMNGTALGGGLEIALACHYRLIIDAPGVQIGLPEVTLGLLPGGGGTVRLPRLLGIQKSLPFLVEGRKVSAKDALAQGLVHALAANRDHMREQAVAWILANPRVSQPWHKKDFRWPGGSPRQAELYRLWSVAPSMANAKTYGHYPAPMAILSSVFEGSLLDIDGASAVESRYFAKCAISDVSKNMIATLWNQLNSINKGAARPTGVERYRAKKVGIIGAGMMGSGIAYVTARQGAANVVLKDETVAKAEQGKAYSAQVLGDMVKKGRLTEEVATNVLNAIQTTDSDSAFSGCDLLIEAVYENRELKAGVTKAAAKFANPDTLMASNTSTLPIASLAAAVPKPERFVGLHFFSPVDKMKLVEIIRAERTSDETLAQAFDYVLQIGKTPIVVNDRRGFFTSRVFQTYLLEGFSLLVDGQQPRLIESAGLRAGMPVGPLALADEVSLSLIHEITEQTRRDYAAQNLSMERHPGMVAVDLVYGKFGRPGRKARQGFYEYPARHAKYLWPDLNTVFKALDPLPTEVLVERLLFAQSLEAIRAVEDNVVTKVADANIGSIFGWGFPAFRGGVLQWVNSYGVAKFVERARALEKEFGTRFAPPQSLVDMAKAGRVFE